MHFFSLSVVGLVSVLTIQLARHSGAGAAPADLETLAPAEQPLSPSRPSRSPLQTFAQRRQWILETVAADPKAAIADATQPFWAAEACFLQGKNDQGRNLARSGYLFWAKKRPDAIRATDFFRLWPAMDCYVRFKDRLDEESRVAFKRLMTSISCYSYSYTPNLSMLMWTTRLLGEQEWGDAAFVPMRSDTTSHYRADPTIPVRDRLLRVGQRASDERRRGIRLAALRGGRPVAHPRPRGVGAGPGTKAAGADRRTRRHSPGTHRSGCAGR